MRPLQAVRSDRPRGRKTNSADEAAGVAPVGFRVLALINGFARACYLVSETSKRLGWGPDGIDIAPMGAMPGQIAALKRGDIDGRITDLGNALDLEQNKVGRILLR
jgi:hypothetical protein